MFKNFIKTAFRSLWKNRSYSFLNIFGLAIGVACAGLIFLWVEDEVNYDKVFAKKDVLYNIRENQTYDGVARTFVSTPGPLAPAIKAEIPGIANACRLNRMQQLFSLNDKAIYENGCYADSSIFSMLTMDFVQGNIKNVFANPNSVVITEKMSEHFFGKGTPAIGKALLLDNKESFIVKAVVKDLPTNSSLRFDWFIPFEVYSATREYTKIWGNNSVNTYVELVPGANIENINKQLYDFIEKKQTGATARAFLFAMNDWRLRDHFENGKQNGGRIEFVRMFTIIAWIILLIACINFMNLATARSEKRAREVGVRKVMGAQKKWLIIQFIGEAVFLSILAVIVGLIIIKVSLPFFNTLVEKKLEVGLTQPLHISVLCSIALLCGVVAGSYPALYLSSFNPIYVFKGLLQKNNGAAFIRKGLVVLQFSISIILIISTMIIYQQIQHVKNRELGYDKNNLISIDSRGDIIKNFSVIRQELINTGVVVNAGLNSFNTMWVGNNSSGYEWSGKDKSKDILISNRLVSPELIPTLGVSLTAGRQFNPDGDSDSTNIIITESLAAVMGGGTVIGKKIQMQQTQYEIVGVVKDYVYGDMYGLSDPIIFRINPKAAKFMYVRIRSGAEIQDALAKIEAVLKKNNPAYPFAYSFVDDQFNDLFKAEMLIGKLSRVFAVLAIMISCLGLFGLAAYTAERRTKEIGIRKVLGASVTGITRLLSKDFIQLVLLANLIAFPAAWWSMNKWLQGYAYRIQINWWIFLVAGAGAILIALITISFQSVKAALMNPVKSLRTE